MKLLGCSWLLVLLLTAARGEEILFREEFHAQLQPGWKWEREHPGSWRLGDGALEIRIEPGNMWGPANDARNVLIRDLPATDKPIDVSITVSNQPTAQYEQVDLVAFFDDSHMVKIGFELVDGKRSIVMGREENDRTRTIAILPIEPVVLDLRLRLEGTNVQGSFRASGAAAWREAGHCDLPGRDRPRVALQCYQGPKDAEHWARITRFIVRESVP